MQKLKEHQPEGSPLRAQRKFGVFSLPDEPEQFLSFQFTVMRLVSRESECTDAFSVDFENTMTQPEVLETALEGAAFQLNGYRYGIHTQRDEILFKMFEEIKEDSAKVLVLVLSTEACFRTE